MTSTAALVGGWLQRVRYKPDTRIELGIDPHHPEWDLWGIPLVISRRVPDSTRGLSTLAEYADLAGFVLVQTKVQVPITITRYEDFDLFVRWLHDELRRVEQHELDEWFRVDGALPFDPHREVS